MSKIDPVLAQVDSSLEAFVSKLLELISFPSVSSEASGKGGIEAAAKWLKRELAEIGLSVDIVTTVGHPIVLARSSPKSGKAGPRLLFYGHYDVQPAAPLEDWRTPPFEPTIVQKDGLHRIYGRGASDSKSQLWSFITAMHSWRAVHNELPAEIVVMLEGEEETGSPSLGAFIEAYRKELSCDVAFICDSDMWSRNQPAITTRLKGLLHDRVTIKTPNGDLHSGHFGSVAANPIRILSKILAAIHDDDGRVTIDGFYEGVEDVPAVIRAQWQALAETSDGAAEVNTAGSVQEPGYTPLELMWARPTIDFNGITGGNQGPGERSVLPASATARLSFRLVGDQDPEIIRKRFRQFVEDRLPAGCSASFEGQQGCGAVTIREDSPFIAATARGLEAEWQKPAVIKGTGGTIPLVKQLNDGLGVDCVVVGFILPGDAIHAPNEHYDVERFHKGTRSWVRIFDEVRKISA